MPFNRLDDAHVSDDKDGTLVPFDGLTPDVILSALEASGFEPDGRLLALNSYENRVFQVGLDDGDFIITKFYRPDRWSDAAILEELQFLEELSFDELPIVAALSNPAGDLLHHYGGFRFASFPRRGGYAPELNDPDDVERMGRLMARVHLIGGQKAFSHRPTLDIESFGIEPRNAILALGLMGNETLKHYEAISTEALTAIENAYQQAGPIEHLRLHGDAYPGNVLWSHDGPLLVDFDDSRMGPAVQDLWMLLTGNRHEQRLDLELLIEGYETFRSFNSRELHLVEALRTLRLIHYAAWIARRWNDPAFPKAFPWFGTTAYWEERCRELEDQMIAMNALHHYGQNVITP
ncbi:MAG: serine/threonine protein kinase [Methylococcus sp.]|nr:MAG: serine/threonine protein kinase [Methylococcus sp.]